MGNHAPKFKTSPHPSTCAAAVQSSSDSIRLMLPSHDAAAPPCVYICVHRPTLSQFSHRRPLSDLPQSWNGFLSREYDADCDRRCPAHTGNTPQIRSRRVTFVYQRCTSYAEITLSPAGASRHGGIPIIRRDVDTGNTPACVSIGFWIRARPAAAGARSIRTAV